MYDIESFSLDDMSTLGAELRQMGENASGAHMIADAIVRHLYRSFVMKDGITPAFGLVRLFVTHRFYELNNELQAYVLDKAADAGLLRTVVKDTRCLTLLSSAGDLPEWNDPRNSANHRAIPLSSPDLPEKFPMIARVLQQFGIEVGAFVEASESFVKGGVANGVMDDLLVDREQSTFNVFHIPEAAGSPYISVQSDFVRPHKIKSVLGFGGVLSAGQIFAIVLFSHTYISREAAQKFKPLALSAKNALVQVSTGRISPPVPTNTGELA